MLRGGPRRQASLPGDLRLSATRPAVSTAGRDTSSEALASWRFLLRSFVNVDRFDLFYGTLGSVARHG